MFLIGQVHLPALTIFCPWTTAQGLRHKVYYTGFTAQDLHDLNFMSSSSIHLDWYAINRGLANNWPYQGWSGPCYRYR